MQLPMLLLLQLVVATAVVGAMHRAPRAPGLQCERITVPACQGLGYNMTALPNGHGHADQAAADVAVGGFSDVVL